MISRLTLALPVLLLAAPLAAAAPELDLTRAVVLTPAGLSGPAGKAVRMLSRAVSAMWLANSRQPMFRRRTSPPCLQMPRSLLS